MSRILGLDIGERRTGVAISDGTGTIAQPLHTLTHRNDAELLTAVSQLVSRYNVALVVIGLPLSLSGKPSTRSERIRRFAKKVAQKTGLPVKLVDERFSTNQAHQIYAEVCGRSHPLYKKDIRGIRGSPVDRIAAALILESYLYRLHQSEEARREP